MRSALTVCVMLGASVGGCTSQPYANDVPDEKRLLIFHNNSGPMCLAALEWLASVRSEYPTLVIEEHLTYEIGEGGLLAELETQYQSSQGVSTSFAYLPIVFFRGQAFSGFDDEVIRALQELLLSAEGESQNSSAPVQTGSKCWRQAWRPMAQVFPGRKCFPLDPVRME